MRCYLEGIITPTNVNQKKKKMPLPKVKCHIKKFYMYERDIHPGIGYCSG